jgi:hypothetical protein
MPGSWHLVKQLASDLRLQLIEDAINFHFYGFIDVFTTVGMSSPFGMSFAIR